MFYAINRLIGWFLPPSLREGDRLRWKEFFFAISRLPSTESRALTPKGVRYPGATFTTKRVRFFRSIQEKTKKHHKGAFCFLVEPRRISISSLDGFRSGRILASPGCQFNTDRVRFSSSVKKKTKRDISRCLFSFSWWSRGESNSCPKSS